MAKRESGKTPLSAPAPKRRPSEPAAVEPSGFNLGDLFGRALQAVTDNRQTINALDGHNGNHGDNMVDNMRLVTEALQSRGSEPPADALAFASQLLQSQGRGGTSQYYARGLGQAAQQLQGQSSLDSDSVMTLVQSLLGAIPSEGFVEQPPAQESVLGSVLGLLGGAQPQPQARAQAADGKLDAGDVISALLPAGVAFLQARQSGSDTTTAAGQALMAALMSGQANPLQTRSPRAAAGGLIAQTILQALTR